MVPSEGDHQDINEGTVFKGVSKVKGNQTGNTRVSNDQECSHPLGMEQKEEL